MTDPRAIAARIIQERGAIPERKTAPMRLVRKAHSKVLRDEPMGLIFEITNAILDAREHRWIAYELIANHGEAYRLLDRRKLESLGQGIDSWWTADAFARTLSGPAWRDGLIDEAEKKAYERVKRMLEELRKRNIKSDDKE